MQVDSSFAHCCGCMAYGSLAVPACSVFIIIGGELERASYLDVVNGSWMCACVSTYYAYVRGLLVMCHIVIHMHAHA